jgi:hypothetical protein
MPGVKAARSVRGLAHAHVGRQAAVDEWRERPRGQRRLGHERRHLSARVHAGIGAAGPVEPHVRFVQHVRQRLLDRSLHRALSGWVCQPWKPVPS